MYQYNKNKFIINGKTVEFSFEIRKVLEYKDKYIILLSIPYDKNELNNIFCLDKKGTIIWKAEDLNKLFPKLKNIPYEQMGIINDQLFASDFYGRNYKINLFDGKVEEYNIVK